MSTSVKRRHSSALFDAHEFRELFRGTFLNWEFAGSLRRLLPEVGDVEHVVIPMIELRDVGLFGETEPVNLLWVRSEELLRENKISEHIYPNGTGRWGEKYRGISYRGFAHEIFCADAANFGSVLAIRTGPAEYSKNLVTKFHRPGCRLIQKDGYLRYKNSGDVFSVPTEEAYFAACGVPWVSPEKRG